MVTDPKVSHGHPSRVTINTVKSRENGNSDLIMIASLFCATNCLVYITVALINDHPLEKV